MQRLRTIAGFVRVLVALFVGAQFSGVVPSPLASSSAFASAIASHDHHSHMHHRAGAASADHDGDQDCNHTDHCCALHAFFTGVLPAAIAVEVLNLIGQPIGAALNDSSSGADTGGLYRPPRPFAPI